MSTLGERTVLAIDPGSSKSGIALVQRTAEGKIELLWRTIARGEDLEAKLNEAMAHRAFGMVIVGAGTNSKAIVHRVREEMPGCGILVIDEKDTTMQARERYWEFNKRRGWRKLLPSTLQVPPEPVDDLVALILAERVLGE